MKSCHHTQAMEFKTKPKLLAKYKFQVARKRVSTIADLDAKFTYIHVIKRHFFGREIVRISKTATQEGLYGRSHQVMTMSSNPHYCMTILTALMQMVKNL